MTGIYQILNIKNGKRYIGQSVNMEHRWAQHLYELRHNTHHGLYLQHVFNKCPDDLEFEIICECKENELNELEIFYINKYKSNDNRYGYNTESGGNGRGRASKEQRERMSRAKMGNTAMRGISLSEEWKKHLSEAQPHRKRIVCVETKVIYESFADAARKTGLNRTKIVSCCTGKRNVTGGYHFKYADKS